MSLQSFLENFTIQDDTDLFSDSGRRTLIDNTEVEGMPIPRFINEFWTSGQRQGHSLHEVSYRACFKPQLPRFFIDLLSQEGDLVYDPFMGRGTTLLEAALLNRRVGGNDINPLSRILLEPRLEVPDIADISARLDSLNLFERVIKSDIDLDMFYSPQTLRQILGLREYLKERKEQNAEDAVDRWIRMVASNRLTGHSPGFFSVYTLPPNQAVSPQAQIKINEKRKQEAPDRDVKSIILKKSISLQKDLTQHERAMLRAVGKRARFFNNDAREATDLEPESVSLVVTSPPFLDIVQYKEDNWLRCWFNYIDAAAVGEGITTTPSLGDWRNAMRGALDELRRILKPNGWIAFEVGEVRGGKILLDEAIAPIGSEVGLRCHGIVINDQEFTKTSNCWGVKNNNRGTNSNRIVLFRKETT